jgi:ferritin-like metal-binding protein YciE
MQDLLKNELRDLYSAERQLIKALPRLAKAATSDTLREAFENHLEETRGHAERLEEICAQLGIRPGGKKCKGMEGLIEEGKEILEEDAEDAVRDAALIAAAQKVEHYEMAGYGCAITYAEMLGEEDAVEMLKEILEEEKAADENLTGIAEGEVNEMALATGGEEEEEED